MWGVCPDGVEGIDALHVSGLLSVSSGWRLSVLLVVVDPILSVGNGFTRDPTMSEGAVDQATRPDSLNDARLCARVGSVAGCYLLFDSSESIER